MEHRLGRHAASLRGLVVSLLLIFASLLVANAQPDPYEILGLGRRASDADVKSRWRELARKL